MTEASLSIAQHYHDRTKYDPQTIASKNKQLDWEQQPLPFKEYKIGVSFDLKPYLKTASEALSLDKDVKMWQRLSRLLMCSYGLTAKIPTFSGFHYLRTAPSAGGLYPGDVSLISRVSIITSPAPIHYFSFGTMKYGMLCKKLVSFIPR
jgi:hypothetical protein